MPSRGNGLEASSYTPLADLEPRLADAMLEAFRDEGVAAYVVPASQHSAGLTMKEFRGPLDRLWVDATAKSQAQRILDARLPALREELERHAVRPDQPGPGGPAAPGGEPDHGGEPDSDDEQAAWAAIVASYHTGPDDPVPRWPVLEDIEESAAEPGGRTHRGAKPAADADADDRAGDPPEGAAREGEAGARADRDDDHFVPPPPPPLPNADPITKAAWAALLGGPIYLFVAAVIGLDVGPWTALLAAGAFVGGFVTLVARMGDRPPTDSGPDDGAVV